MINPYFIKKNDLTECLEQIKMPFRPATSLLVQKGFDKRKEEELSRGMDR